MRVGCMRVGGMRVGGMRVRGMGVPRDMDVGEESPALSWEVLVSGPLNGCRGGILADGWVAD